MLELRQTKRTDKDLLVRMENHYSKPKGFVGNVSIDYAFCNTCGLMYHPASIPGV